MLAILSSTKVSPGYTVVTEPAAGLWDANRSHFALWFCSQFKGMRDS